MHGLPRTLLCTGPRGSANVPRQARAEGLLDVIAAVACRLGRDAADGGTEEWAEPGGQ